MSGGTKFPRKLCPGGQNILRKYCPGDTFRGGKIYYDTCPIQQTCSTMSRDTGTGVAGIWGPPDYGDPRPNITSDIQSTLRRTI